MAWNKYRIAMCEDCENGRNVHDEGDFHEVCEAGVCMLCFQTEKMECDRYIPIKHRLSDCIEKYGDDNLYYDTDLPDDAMGVVCKNADGAVYLYRFEERGV